MNTFLAFDIGGTKIAWGTFNDQGKLLESNQFPTPQIAEELVNELLLVIDKVSPQAIGVCIAGVPNEERIGLLYSPNIPKLADFPLLERLQEKTDALLVLDNDARCALIGEVWQGEAKELSSCVLITLGTGVGGAVMQKGLILPHPRDIGREVGRVIVDPQDVFPNRGGQGTVEAFLGGKNLEKRLQIDMREMAQKVRKGDEEAIEAWEEISYFFIQSLRAIHETYSCKTIIIGGIGSKDLEYYLQAKPPCPVIAAKLGEKAGLYGAARLALDKYTSETSEDWDQ